jgi:hypothetical protein
MNLSNLESWSWRRDLNPRPSDYKPNPEASRGVNRLILLGRSAERRCRVFSPIGTKTGTVPHRHGCLVHSHRLGAQSRPPLPAYRDLKVTVYRRQNRSQTPLSWGCHGDHRFVDDRSCGTLARTSAYTSTIVGVRAVVGGVF